MTPPRFTSFVSEEAYISRAESKQAFGSASPKRPSSGMILRSSDTLWESSGLSCEIPKM